MYYLPKAWRSLSEATVKRDQVRQGIEFSKAYILLYLAFLNTYVLQ